MVKENRLFITLVFTHRQAIVPMLELRVCV
jgi:hypothetical protein